MIDFIDAKSVVADRKGRQQSLFFNALPRPAVNRARIESQCFSRTGVNRKGGAI